MTKQKLIIRRFSRDRGVALLFALGILSALMLLGIAFMGSSIFSRRIAENRSNGVDAMILARSTANLVAAAVMQFHDDYGAANTAMPLDYRSVFSVGDPARQSSDQDVYGERLREHSRGSRSNYSRLDVPSLLPYHGNDSSAQWCYVRVRDDNNANGRIVGRYAYQVLPTPGYGRLNLYRTLAARYEKMRSFPGAPAARGSQPVLITSSGTSNNLIPRDARWGQSTAELDFRNADYLYSLHDADTFKATQEIPADFANLYAAEVFSRNRGADLLSRNNVWRAWMESTFTEGTNPGFPEVAPGKHARFNLAAESGTDSWYCRFGTGATPNSATVLDSLTRQVDFFGREFEYDTDIASTDLHPGLAFLRYIGNDPGSFDSLSNLRHQIAANLNDYCDSDSIPTSDVAAASWAVDPADSSHVPTYTGNERTLYINEIALGGLIQLNASDSSSTITLDTADLVLCAELIDIYGNTASTGNLSEAGYSLKGKIPQATVSGGGSAASQNYFSVQVIPQFSLDYKYVVKENDNEQPKNGTFPEWNPSVEDAFVAVAGSTDPADTRTVNLTEDPNYNNVPFSSNTAGPYKVSAKQVATKTSDSVSWQLQPESTLINNSDAKTKIKDSIQLSAGQTLIDNSIEITAVKLKKIKITLSGFHAAIGNLVLNDGTNNVDYVRTENIETPSSNAPQSEYVNVTGSPVPFVFLVGGMEAKDPRQNLNVKKDATAWSGSDWVWSPTMTVVTATGSISGTSPSLSGTIAKEYANTGALETAMQGLAGQVNSEASPSGTYSTDRDTETAVTDPGWTRTGTQISMISTAVIRNAPMRSPWELGLIHRGVQFQTIDLKRADYQPTAIRNSLNPSTPNNVDNWGSAGSSYYDSTQNNPHGGDGAILDWIRMTEANYSDGKINLNQFGQEKTTGGLTVNQNRHRYQSLGTTTDVSTSDAVWAALDRELLTALFENISLVSAKSFVDQVSEAASPINASTLSVDLYNALHSDITVGNLMTMRSDVLGLTNFDWTQNQTNDAKQEELIGRTINLLTASAEPPAVFRAVIVAQSIRDIGGEGANVQVVSSDHPNAMDDAQIGRFEVTVDSSNDPRNNIHYDIITGEAKILVTYERNPVTGKVMIRDIENIE